MGTTKIFKSTNKRDEIRARYGEFLAGMPFIKRYVSTEFGDTFVLEAGDPSVTLDLLIRSLIALGASNRELARIISLSKSLPAT